MQVVSNDDVKKAAEDAAKPAPVPAPVEEPAQAPIMAPHIAHAAVHYGKAQIEARGYELGIATLEAELRGLTEHAEGEVTRIEADVEEEIAEISARARRRVARIREDLVTDASNLNKRIADLKETHAMLLAQIDAYQQMHPKQESPDAQADTEPDPARTGEAGAADGDAQQPGTGGDTAR